jgi:hypothetical protein
LTPAATFQAWFLDVIRDEELAERAMLHAEEPVDPRQSRRRIIDAIRERYVIPDRTALILRQAGCDGAGERKGLVGGGREPTGRAVGVPIGTPDGGEI